MLKKFFGIDCCFIIFLAQFLEGRHFVFADVFVEYQNNTNAFLYAFNKVYNFVAVRLLLSLLRNTVYS